MDNSPFARLPPELRDHIYDAALQFPEDVILSELRREGGVGLYHESKAEISLNLLLTCRQIAKEAVRRLYATNTFTIVQNKGDASCDEILQKFINSIGAVNVESLQSIRISYTLTQGTLLNGQFKAHLRQLRDLVKLIPSCSVKVDLSYIDIYKSILFQAQLDLQSLSLPGTGDAWIGKIGTSVGPAQEDSPDVLESVEFLRSHLRGCRRDIERNTVSVGTVPIAAAFRW